MSQRLHKIASLIQQIVAAELAQLPGSAPLTVTRATVAPDLRTATVWVGVVAPDQPRAEQLFAAVIDAAGVRHQIQQAVAARLSTKFVPRLTLRHDPSGDYADRITRLIDGA